MSSRSYAWLALNGGAWSLPSNWNDLTDGVDPSLIAPGPQDSVTVSGATGSSTTDILGPGSALQAAFFNNCALSGSFAFGAMSLGSDGSGGLLAIGAGASVSTGAASIVSGSAVTSGAGAVLSVSGALSLGGGGSANLDATSGGRIQLGALSLSESDVSIYVDAASSIEIGKTGGARPGALTIDAGATLTGLGNADGYGPIVNNGTIDAEGGGLLVGPLTGTGLLSIGADAVLELNGTTGAGQSVVFAAPGGTLALATEFDGPQGTIAGFVAGDAIDILGSSISSASYFPEGNNVGLLSLYYGSQVAVALNVLGNFAGDIFLTANDGADGTLITVSPESNGGGSLSGGTTNPDQYVWTQSTGGVWDKNTNWQDVTTGANPARVAPGVNNLVTIACAQTGSFSVISGPADAALLAVTGDLAMTGTFAIGSLTLGTMANYGTIGNLDLLPGTRMTVQSLAVMDGELSLTGGTILGVAGTLSLGGGESGVGLPTTALVLSAGATLTALGLTLGGGSGNTITTDPTAVLEIGSAGHAVAGAVTIDAGATLAGNGSVNPYGAIVDNGTIDSEGGFLILGAVTGAGAVSIGTDAGLLLDASSGVAINFIGNDAILAVADERVSASGSITGFAGGDALDIEGDPITSVSVTKFVGGVTLTLYYNTTPVGHFTLEGVYTGDRFFLVPDGGFGTDVLVDNANGGGGGGGQGNTDLLSWSEPVSGYWAKAANWFDVTTNAAASAPPGTLNAVQIVGPTDFTFQTIGGPAVSASMAFFGNTYISGAWETGTLSVGGLPSGSTTLTAGTMEVGAASGMTAINADIVDGLILVAGSNTTLAVTGTLTLGSGGPDAQGPLAELSATGGGIVTLGALDMGGGAGCQLLTDAFSSIEIGTLGDAQAGAVVLDAGFSAAANGSIDPVGLLVDNGTLTAQGGTLQLGNVSGTGVLVIGAAATLELLGTEICPIDMAGAGASLLLGGSSESLGAPISGFVQGDEIIIGTGIVGSVVYTPGAGSVGTLTLYNGGQVAGTLLLAGDYSGATFTVQPDGEGSLIGLAGEGGPSQGTSTPDDYSWIGGTAGSWNTATNWTDVTAGQNPAAIAPGINDLVTVQGGAKAYTSITGPANAASLTVLGEVALIGQYAVGALAIGHGAATGLLALGSGSDVQASQAVVAGGIVAQGGTLTSTGTLALNGGVLIAGGGGVVEVASLVLSGSGDAVSVDASSVLEIGNLGGAAAGAVTIDAGAVLAGVGVIDPTGMIVDAGTITAMAQGGAALSLGTVSGAGTLVVGVGATLQLQGSAAAGLLIDFAGGTGTLSIAGALPLAAIAGFGDGSAIDIPIAGITSASFAITEPNVGILTLDAGTTAVGELTLVGVSQGQAFSVTGAPGGTVLTTTINLQGGGGSNMRGVGPEAGGGQAGVISDFSFWQNLPIAAQQALATFQENVGGTSYVWSSPDGTFGPYQPGYANFGVLTDQNSVSAGSTVALPPGYDALLLQGSTPLRLTDGAGNNVLLMGNSANDTIVGNGPGDTLVGGVGANSVIYAAETATVIGGGNDAIISTGDGPCNITTSADGRSIVFAGPSSGNVINLSGSDTFIGAGGNGALDSVTAVGAATVFAPSEGLINFYGGSGVDLVVGSTGTVRMYGGIGNGSVLWCGQATDAIYEGGGGSAAVIGGSGGLFVQGGAGAMSVYGGTGITVINGTAGPSQFVAGFGASTINAASGNLVWLVGSANDSLIASGGNATVWGANSSGNNVFQAGSGPCTMSGGVGNDTFLGGSGSALLLSGGGADVFSFTNGLAGDTDIINGFNPGADQIDLHGYSGYASNLVGGNEVLSLSDGTSITLSGIGSLSGVVIQVV